MEQKTRLFLIRHGETTTSAEYRYIGHLDVDITQNGVAQMVKLKERFRNEEIDIFFGSDLIRAKRGVEIIASCHRTDPILYREFREIHLGVWEGLTRDEIVKKYPEEYQQRLSDLAHHRIQGGESFKDLQLRVMKKLSSVIREFKGKNILIVAHGGVNRVILFDALKLDLQLMPRIDQAYGCVNIIDYYEDSPVVRLVNG